MAVTRTEETSPLSETPTLQQRVERAAVERSQFLYGAVLVLAALQNIRRPVLLDDAYITFRAAANFAAGNGLVFNPGELVLSTTAPGFALILAGCAAVGLDIVACAKAICAAALGGAALSMLCIGIKNGFREAGFIAGLMLCFFPELFFSWGNESPLLLMCVLGGYVLCLEKRFLAAGLVLAVGCTIRPDVAVAGIAMAGWVLCAEGVKALVWLAVGPTLIGAAWFSFLYSQFGELLPNTMGIKMEQGRMLAEGDPRALPVWMSFQRGLLWLLRRRVFDTPFGFLTILGGLVCVMRPRTYALLGWVAAHLAAYFVMRVPGHYYWYYYPVWAVLCLMTGVGAEFLIRLIVPEDRRGVFSSAQSAVLALSVSVGAFCGLNLMGQIRDPWFEQKWEAYNRMAAVIRQHVRPGETVVMDEVGQLGYYSGAKVLDSHGLLHKFPSNDMILNLDLLVRTFEPEYIVDAGWRRSTSEDYRRAALAGEHAVHFKGADGRPLVYRQVGLVVVGDEFYPTLLKREEAAPTSESEAR